MARRYLPPLSHLHPASKRGRRPGADWDAYYLAFKAKVEADGDPDALNVEGWNKQARRLSGLA